MSKGKIAAGITATIVLIAGLSIGGWQLGWWMQSYSVNRTAQIYQHGYGAQSAYSEELERLIVQIDGLDVQINDPTTPADEVSALQAQKAAMVIQGCDIASKLTVTPPNNIQQFVSANCLA